MTGRKNSGKSAFCRALINAVLSRKHPRRVFLLDADVGQPVFGTPFSMSLLRFSDPLFSNDDLLLSGER